MKVVKLIIITISIAFTACNRPISTTREWVSFCKNERNAEKVYNEFLSIAPSNSITIYRELEMELANNDNCHKETCYAFLYMFSLLAFDIDTHSDKYTLGDIGRFNEISNCQDYFIAMANSSKQVKDVSAEVKTFEKLSGSSLIKTE